MMAHVIGYTGEISEQELDSPEFAKYKQGDRSASSASSASTTTP
jgi:hypothetical protein